jgi:hypothetical protein
MTRMPGAESAGGGVLSFGYTPTNIRRNLVAERMLATPAAQRAQPTGTHDGPLDQDVP